MAVRIWRQPLAPQDMRTLIGASIIIITALTAPFFGGWDYLVALRAETLSGIFLRSYNPYPAYWLFYPFAVLPPVFGYAAWNLVNAGGFIGAARYWRSDLLRFALSMPCLWIFYGGEFEGFLAGALVVALTANPWLAGLGIFVLTIKPQVGLVLILFVVLQRRDYRLLVIPAILYLLSFVTYGWWVTDWLVHIQSLPSRTAPTNITLYPSGLVALLLLFRYRSSLKVWIMSAALALPYFPIYSLAVLFSMESPSWWIIIGIWLWYSLPSLIPRFAFLPAFGFMIPLLLLILEVWKSETGKHNQQREQIMVSEE
jgi:hypothetical protein